MFSNTGQLSYTSWFLEAFNRALADKVDLINLSIGGPDHSDMPFYDKIRELSAAGITVVSAIGNDGPLFGTTNHPGNQVEVIGVGAASEYEGTLFIPEFSSRGMTLQELSTNVGIGRPKPNILAHGVSVRGLSLDGRSCDIRDGTSFAAPIVSGVLALVTQMLRANDPSVRLSHALFKQILSASTKVVPGQSLFAQGAGALDASKLSAAVKNFKPTVTAFPDSLDFTACPMFWPYCAQPIFVGAQPVTVNLTILNSIDVSSTYISDPTVTVSDCSPHIEVCSSKLLEVTFEHETLIWPWSGTLSVSFSAMDRSLKTEAILSGSIIVSISSTPGPLMIPFKVKLAPSPPRHRRILWDQFHSLHYPLDFYPRDDLNCKNPLDLNADHLYTNHRSLFNYLISLGYAVDILAEPLTSFNASEYGTLIISDPEQAFSEAERLKLVENVEMHGLSLLVLGEWDCPELRSSQQFFDKSSQSLKSPCTGGMNMASVNNLLSEWGIGFVPGSWSGEVNVGRSGARGKVSVPFNSGAELWIRDSHGVSALVALKMISDADKSTPAEDIVVLALKDFNSETHHEAGRLVVYGDSALIDDSSFYLKEGSNLDDQGASIKPPVVDNGITSGMEHCLKFFAALLEYTSQGVVHPMLRDQIQPAIESGYHSLRGELERGERHDGSSCFSRDPGSFQSHDGPVEYMSLTPDMSRLENVHRTLSTQKAVNSHWYSYGIMWLPLFVCISLLFSFNYHRLRILIRRWATKKRTL